MSRLREKDDICKYCHTKRRVFSETDKVEHYQCLCAVGYRWKKKSYKLKANPMR